MQDLTNQPQSESRLKNIQILRAIAATLVVIDHSISQFQNWPQVPEGIERIGFFLGEQGVAIFFVISGFIISRTAKNFGSWKDSTAFIVQRLLRIIPIYWLFTIIAYLLIKNEFWLKGRIVNIENLILSLGFIPYGEDPMRPILGQGWSLEYEIFFYIIFGAFIIFPKKICTLLTIGTLTVLISLGLINSLIFNAIQSSAINYFTSPIIILFGIGILIEAKKITINTTHPIIITLLLILLQTATLSKYYTDTTFNSAKFISWIFASIIVMICISSTKKRVTKFELYLVKIGDASYSMYLSHIFAVYAASKLWRVVLGENHHYALAITTLILCIAVAIFTYQLIEIPINKKSKEINKRLNGILYK